MICGNEILFFKKQFCNRNTVFRFADFRTFSTFDLSAIKYRYGTITVLTFLWVGKYFYFCLGKNLP